MARRMESTTVYLTPEQMCELRRISARTRVPMNVYVRDGVDLVLAKLRQEDASRMAVTP